MPSAKAWVSGFASNATHIVTGGFFLPWLTTCAHGISVLVTVTDAVGNYAVGIYDINGNLKLHTTAQHLPSTFYQDLVVVETLPVTLQPGIYFFGWSGTAAVAGLAINDTNTNQIVSYSAQESSNLATTPGVMNATITPPARGSPWTIGGDPVFIIW